MPKPARIAAAALAAAATAQGFLIPPELSATDIKVADLYGTSLLPTPGPKFQRALLACPGCPILVDGQVVADAPANHLVLDFSIAERPGGGDELSVNGLTIQPHLGRPGLLLEARQILDSSLLGAQGEDGKEPEILHGMPAAFSIGVGQLGQEAVNVDLHIDAVNGAAIRGIPTVHVRLVRDQSGRLAFLEPLVLTAPRTGKPAEDGAACTTMMCRWMAMIHDKLAHVKPKFGCHGGKTGVSSTTAHDGTAATADPATITNGDEEEPHRHGGHGGWRHGDGHHHHHTPHILPHHKPEHSWGQLFKNIASHVLLPVLIGIAAGVAASMIGMVVGTAAVALWRTFFRGRRCSRRRSAGPSEHKAAQKEAAAAEEKAGLMDDSDVEAPPAYNDAAVEVAGDDDKKPGAAVV